MKLSLVLCEGKSDAIIIGYLLMKMYGWIHVKKLDPSIAQTLKVERNQSYEWFRKKEQEDCYVALFGVGGKDRFREMLKAKIAPMQTRIGMESCFSRILLICDRDYEEMDRIEESLLVGNDKYPLCFRKDRWHENDCLDGYGRHHVVQTCLVVIPNDKEGALENTILDSISEDAYDKAIVDACIDFVEENKEKAKRYLNKRRLVEKAKLSVTFAMMSPEKVFDFLDEILMDVNWEKKKGIVKDFQRLGEL